MKWWTLAVLSVGCIPTNAQIESSGQTQLKTLKGQAHEEILDIKTVWESEMAKASEQLKATLIYRQCDGVNTPHCGLTVPAMVLGYDDFALVYCTRVTQAFCLSWYESKILEALQRRYRYEGSPHVGESLSAFEERLIKDHNDKAYASYEDSCQRLNAMYTVQVNTALAEYENNALEIREQTRQDIEDAEHARTVLKAVAVAVAAGAKAYGDSMQRSSYPQARGCISDYACPSGQWCVKGVGQMYGDCAHVVNRFKTPTYAPPRSESFSPGRAQCRNSLECPYGFRCDQGNCTN